MDKLDVQDIFIQYILFIHVCYFFEVYIVFIFEFDLPHPAQTAALRLEKTAVVLTENR